MKLLKIAVVIPCYKVKKFILPVIQKIGPEVNVIYIVDDCCPEHSGDHVAQMCLDSRISIIRHTENKGVGGAVMSGYKAALESKCDVVVKLDGDGQMDPALINEFIAPILTGEANYTKGNRFHDLERVRTMPFMRLFGNAMLSFITKFSTGYYHLFDPTNGYTAISSKALRLLPLSKISNRYFFESDILFRLNTVNAVVEDVPMDAVYGDEISNLNIKKILLPFLKGHCVNFCKRIFYNYFLRDFSIASIELIFGLGIFLFGLVFGIYAWHDGSTKNQVASSGTVMISALPIIIGVQLLLSFLQYDIARVPTKPLK